MKTAFLFSGQGAQYAGMGRELYDNFDQAKEIFDQADKALGYSMKDICFSDEEKLAQTEYAQPAILTMSIAALRVLESEGIRADVMAGLSLGEYSAYVAAGILDFKETAALVRKRGHFMEEAVPSGRGSMYAIIGLENEKVEAACMEAQKTGYVTPANYNAPGQIVIAGEAEATQRAAEISKEKGAKMAVKLNVSGPFHTKLLKSAADNLEKELSSIAVSEFKTPVYTNLTGEKVMDISQIKDILVKQVVSPVRFEQIVRKMHEEDGIDTFIEIGPGKVLSGFVKRTVKGVKILNIENLVSLEKVKLKSGVA